MPPLTPAQIRPRQPRLRSLRHGRGVLLVLCIGALALLVRPARADVVVPRKGKRVEGAVVKDDGVDVRVNIYFSRNPGVKNEDHFVILPKSKVKDVRLTPRPEVEFWRRLQKAKGAPDKLYELGTYAKEHKLKREARLAFAMALVNNATHAPSLKAIGGKTGWAKAQRGNVYANADLRSQLITYIDESDPATRAGMAAKLKAAGFAAKPPELERYRRSALQPTGYERNRPITLRSDVHAGATYALYVPKSYTPWSAWPLIIGLHGGGPDGKTRDEVVGSGPSAMNFYRRLAADRGYIVACPNALVALWGRKPNEAFVRDLIEELKLLYNVDTDRVYLTGHSMGGFGTWALGPRLITELAAASPMAGGGGTVSPFVQNNVPIFIFHSSDDRVVGHASDAANAKQLLGSGHDFVYTEFADAGHGFPNSVQVELFDFFEPRRRFDKKRKSAWPRSSFLGKVTKDEKTYFGDPMGPISGAVPTLKTWTAALRLGGGAAASAATQIAGAKPEGAVGAVAKVLGAAALPFDARGYAARTLGLLGDGAASSALGKAVAVPATKHQSFVAVESAKALIKVRGEGAPKALEKAVTAWVAYFADKRSGDDMRFSDFQRSVRTLQVLVDAWAKVASVEDDAKRLAKAIAEGVFAPAVNVQTSSRVPQDPAAMRTALASALGRALEASQASDAVWSDVRASLEAHSAAQKAFESVRK